jgi:REDY-like protein HapK
MATRIAALFNRKPGVSVAPYEAWAKGTDIPAVNGLKSVDEFAVLKTVARRGSDARPPHQYVEVIDVGAMDVFGGEVSAPAMQKIASAFQAMTDDLVFLLTERLG